MSDAVIITSIICSTIIVVVGLIVMYVDFEKIIDLFRESEAEE